MGLSPIIKTVFDGSSANPHNLLYSGFIQSALARLLPSDFFFSEGKGQDLQKVLPLLHWTEWGEHLSLFLITRHRVNAAKFFYEMVSRWLLPGRRLNISSFLATDFKFSEMEGELFTFCEIVISIEPEEIETIRSHLPVLEAEIRLGLVSVYHANRILEIKGLSVDEKTALVQERIASLLKRRPADFDYDIFSQMQHFLVMCGEEFKAAREYSQMSRIIYVFYLFQKGLRQQMEAFAGHRHLQLKFCRTNLHLPFGSKRVLGILVGINFLNDNELFEQRHLLEALKLYFPGASAVEGSYFTSTARNEAIQLVYLEVEKGDGSDFTTSELKLLQERLPDDLKNGVEKLMRPLFMPRNEEEVMRNIITLSNQLKYPRDLPQVIISFEGQTDDELLFTIIYLRVVPSGAGSLQEMFQREDTFLRFIPDRVKAVGMMRKKHPKEATVFRVALPAIGFLRQDHSVDLLKARQAVMSELQRIAGEVRDYNGGMIAKQHEQFLILKDLCAPSTKKEEVFLEKFFHSLFPIEMRSFVAPGLLKSLYTLLLEAVDKNKENKVPIDCLLRREEKSLYVLISNCEERLKDKIGEAVAQLRLPSSQLVSLSLEASNIPYLGFIFRSEDQSQRSMFEELVRDCCR